MRHLVLALCLVGLAACTSGRIQSAVRGQEGRGLGVVPAVGAAAPGRAALVIGNAAYDENIGPLKNPGNDATDMAAMLRQLGFGVTLVRDATHQRMAEAIEDFSRQLRPRSVGVFYYAGHGAQVGGRNYLIPLGARITTEAAVPYQAVAAEEVLARMDGAGQGQSLNVIILDACRNAPFMRGWRSPLRGLAPMQATGGSLVAYATSPGAVAADGTGRNGTYTRHLLHFMTEPNLPVELMFKQVRSAVEQETNGQQIPWELSSLRENFSFHPGASGTTSTPVVSTPAVATPPPSPSPSTSGGTQVAVGVYPPQPQAPLATIVGNDGAEMVLVPAGEFIMGSGGWKPEEAPQHRVYLDAFYIDKYEVTNTRFQQFVQATGHRTQAEREGSGAVYTGQQWELVNGANWRCAAGSRQQHCQSGAAPGGAGESGGRQSLLRLGRKTLAHRGGMGKSRTRYGRAELSVGEPVGRPAGEFLRYQLRAPLERPCRQ